MAHEPLIGDIDKTNDAACLSGALWLDLADNISKASNRLQSLSLRNHTATSSPVGSKLPKHPESDAN